MNAAHKLAISENYKKALALEESFEPEHNYVVILKDPPDTMCGPGSLLEIPELSHEFPMWGYVMAKGPGYINIFNGVEYKSDGIKVGDRVMFAPYGGFTLHVGGMDFQVFQHDEMHTDLFAKVDIEDLDPETHLPLIDISMVGASGKEEILWQTNEHFPAGAY